MKSYRTTARVFGNDPDIFQDMVIIYDVVYSGARLIVTHCQLLIDKFLIEPQDVEEDLCQAIAEDLGVEVVFFNAEIETV